MRMDVTYRYQLTGWNIELNPLKNMLRLRSRYAENREDFIELMWYECDGSIIIGVEQINSNCLIHHLSIV